MPATLPNVFDDGPTPATVKPPLLGLARVQGRSMAPTLLPGDRLLVRYAARPRPGCVVLARFPDGTLGVKRAAEAATTRAGEPGWWLLSDNLAEGVDSRHRGVIDADAVLGVVLARVWPRPRLIRRARRGTEDGPVGD